jgi:hypothetical protein
MPSLREIATSCAKRVPSIRRIASERDELRRTVASLEAQIAARDAEERPSHDEIWPVQLTPEHISDHARLFADRTSALVALPTEGRVAELGVGFGDFSAELLSQLKPVRFHAYDTFPWRDSDHLWGRPARETLQGRTHREYYEARFAVERASGILEVFEGDSTTMLAGAPDGFYDVIYIDAEHTYDAVSADAAVAVRKLRNDGFLVFNDYIIYDHVGRTTYGIVPVVNRLCVDDGWEVVYLALHSEMFCDICLRRRDR